jgi:hypothetical protein
MNLVGFPVAQLSALQQAVGVARSAAVDLLRQVHRGGVTHISELQGLGAVKMSRLAERCTIGECSRRPRRRGQCSGPP